jgi:phosphohistidine phosphatase
MKLYLVRHGQAAGNAADAKRNLTRSGRQQARQLAEFLRPMGLHLQAIWHSGIARAAQTAEALAPAVKSEEGLLLHPGIRPLEKTRPAAREISQIDGDLMLVGHEPFLSKLAARLMTGQARRPLLMLDKGGIACLRRDLATDREWRLEWLLTPQMIEALAPMAGSAAPSAAPDSTSP